MSIRNGVKVFDAIVTFVLERGRCICNADDMVKLGIRFRRMIRCVVGAGGEICWTDPWHEIVHMRNQRVRQIGQASHIKTLAENCDSQHWKFACYIATS